MEYRSDKWGTLSAPACKMGPNLLICSCQLCFCVPSELGQLTGKGCKRQRSEALFNPLSKHDSIFFAYWHTGNLEDCNFVQYRGCLSNLYSSLLHWAASAHWFAPYTLISTVILR